MFLHMKQTVYKSPRRLFQVIRRFHFIFYIMLCKYNNEKQFLIKIKINSHCIAFAKILKVKRPEYKHVLRRFSV